MKYIYVWASAAVLLVHAGCSSLKERSASHQRQITTGQAGSALYQSYYDSTGRHWHFWSDSLFYYHPDSGLYGYRGALSVKDAMVSQNIAVWSQDSSKYNMEENSRSDSTSKPKSGMGIMLGILLVIGVFLGIRFFESRD